jgi:hypothetical protein
MPIPDTSTGAQRTGVYAALPGEPSAPPLCRQGVTPWVAA